MKILITKIIPFMIKRDDRSISNYARMVRYSSMGGWGNGYVAICKNHPFYHKHYNFINEQINWECYELTCSQELGNWEDLVQFQSVEENKKCKGLNEKMWVIGFDTCHLYDTLENWPREKVWEETLKLKKILEGFIV